MRTAIDLSKRNTRCSASVALRELRCADVVWGVFVIVLYVWLYTRHRGAHLRSSREPPINISSCDSVSHSVSVRNTTALRCCSGASLLTLRYRERIPLCVCVSWYMLARVKSPHVLAPSFSYDGVWFNTLRSADRQLPPQIRRRISSLSLPMSNETFLIPR